MKQCTRDKKDAKKEEQRRHRDAVRDCDGDSACIQAEAARHSLEMLEIMRAFHECKEHCHEQGGGGGGQ